jgi:hypothetical protein
VLVCNQPIVFERHIPSTPSAAHPIEPMHRMRASESPNSSMSASHPRLATSDSLDLGTYTPRPPLSRRYDRSSQISKPTGWRHSKLHPVPSDLPTGNPRANVFSSSRSATCNYGQEPSTSIQSSIHAGEIGENISPIGPNRGLTPTVYSGCSPHSVHSGSSGARTSVSETRSRLSTVQTPNSCFTTSQPKRKFHSPASYPLAHDDIDPDASWSTLPSRKVSKANAGTCVSWLYLTFWISSRHTVFPYFYFLIHVGSLIAHHQ